MKQLKEYLKKLIKLITKDEMRILPGNIAFFLVLSIIPIITLLGIIGSMFSISLIDITKMLNEFIPQDVEKLLLPFFTATKSGNMIIYFILGFFLASNGAHSIIVASNTLYDTNNSNYIKRRVKALFLTIVLISLFLFVLLFLAFGNIILKFILNLEIFHGIANNIYSLFVYLKWPIAFVIIFLMIKLLYTMAPDKHISSKYVNKGAIFTTVGWVIVTALYSYYANNLANYDVFYGGLSSIIILMMWIYFISYIFVIGIAINTSVYHYLENKQLNNNE